ncbi:MAG TPA: Gfo/Idh/MocA family oxidoreductase [Opitutaceae bacterium]|nr:Gfo/Idh/MocA family oxidoreductase [Opitutaceae bacterium]
MNASSRPVHSRRQFLSLTALAASASLAGSLSGAAPSILPSRKKRPTLNVAVIGTSGRAQNTIRDLLQIESVEIVALCDVDPARLARGVELSVEKFPKARRYADYRQAFEKERELNAVVITTPDHMHAPISLLAMSRGLHVFCEKPLSRTIAEARWMQVSAQRSGVMTQMGTQSSSAHTTRRAVELIQAGVIGQVREAHIWTDRSARLPNQPASSEPPPGMAWDTWLGVHAPRPYSSHLHPFRWRWWEEFGCGPLGDMGCHLTNVAYRALDLSAPSEIDVSISDPAAPGLFPASARFDYRFPNRGRLAPMTLSWYEGGRTPDSALIDSLGIARQFGKVPSNNKIIIGDKGILYSDLYVKLNGEERFNGITKHPACIAVPESLPRNAEQGTLGHYREWVDACLGQGTPFASFDLAAGQTEMVLLGTVAAKVGRKIRWDAKTLSVLGEPTAEAMIRPTYREGFTLSSAELRSLSS